MMKIAATGQLLVHQALDLSSPATRKLASFLHQADCAIANLEATIKAPGAWATKTKTLHLAEPAALMSLKQLGFGALAHANNHAFDLGPPGIVATHQAAQKAGLVLAGSGETSQEALRPAVLHTEQGNCALISVDLGPQPQINYADSHRPGLAPLRMERSIICPPDTFQHLQQMADQLGESARKKARQQVDYDAPSQALKELDLFGTRLLEGSALGMQWQVQEEDWRAFERILAQACAEADYVVIALHSHHWDPDWSRAPLWWQALACRMIDLGAHMIVGTGAPVLQTLSFHKQRPILSGLGNCIFHTHRAAVYDQERPAVWQGAACRAHFDAKGQCTRLEIMPLHVGRPELYDQGMPLGPQAMEAEAAAEIFAALIADLKPDERALVHLA
ncbi:MAG: CapA family protein [Alphaproteobacteria bacterium]|nr:CapA family protein [Alphaproteobacteria bacterium]